MHHFLAPTRRRNGSLAGRAGGVAGLVCLLALSAPAQSRPPSPKPLAGKQREAFLKSVQKAMTGRTEVAATFVTEKHYALFDDVVRQRGFILYQRPDRLRWEIQHPFQSILVVTGTDVAKFEIKKGKRRKLTLGRAQDVLRIVMDQIRSWFRGEFEKGNRDYTVQLFAATKKPAANARIVLRPRSKTLRKTVQQFELELAPDLGSVSQVTIREAGGDRTVMRFSRMPAGQRLIPGHFSVQAPAPFTPRPAKKPAKVPPGKKSSESPKPSGKAGTRK